jgi:hypothetical protein
MKLAHFAALSGFVGSVAAFAACSTGDSELGNVNIGDGGPLDDGSTGGESSIDDGGIAFDASTEMGGCVPKTCTELGANCGPVNDGCGGLAMCGTCTAPLTCGGGGKPNVCGSGCKGLTCADLKVECGKQGDGCGGILECGTCTAPQTCGGGGPSKCGILGVDAAGCTTKKTCADYGANCGYVSDGCGSVIKCGDCTAPAICGGGGTPSVCGSKAGTGCVNLACKQTTCATGTTSISGTVYDPAGIRGLPNVFVYVPNAAVAALTSGATCDKCAAALSGSPLVQTTTDVNGKFTLTNMPVDVDVPVVIQIGKWRRQIKVTTAKCVDTPVAASLTNLPRTKAEGDIPKIALATGAADPLECLLLKIGIDKSEFTNPTGTGRVNLYSGLYIPPSMGLTFVQATSKYDSTLNGGATFPSATTLWATADSLKKYDVTLLGCEGLPSTDNKPAAALTAMQQYVNAGGRVFAEHYHYMWMKSGPSPWPGMVSWAGDLDKFANPTQETVLTGFPKGALMNQWMKVWAGATSGTPSLFPVNDARYSVTKINDTTNIIEWVRAPSATTTTPPIKTYSNVTQYFSFNTPVGAGADAVCGRFVYSDIHVASGEKPGDPFPNGCLSGKMGSGGVAAMTAQEKALEFMFFDLASRVCDETVPPPPPTCTKLTCAEAGVTCGPAGDGCGGILDCGSCPCTPQTCMGRCGPQGDGCGGVLACPACDGGPGCTPRTCMEAGAECGIIGDGCGSTVDCGMCVPPETCGGGGTPYKCGGVK